MLRSSGVGLLGVSLNRETGDSLEHARRTEGVNAVPEASDRLTRGLQDEAMYRTKQVRGTYAVTGAS